MSYRDKVAVSVIILGLVAGCSPAGNASDTAVSSVSLPSADSTGLPAGAATESRTLSALEDTQTPSPTKTQLPSKTARPSPSSSAEGIIPTIRPTPTRGLPPTVTLGPLETCPEPTGAQVEILFSEDPLGYGTQILDYFKAYGNSVGLKEQLESLGQMGIKINGYTNESSDYFYNNSAKFYKGDMTGDLSQETIISIMQVTKGGRDFDIATFIVGCASNQFQLLFGEKVGNGFPMFSDGIYAVRDLNGNGIRELVYSYGLTLDAHGTDRVASQILEWDGTAFRKRIRSSSDGRLIPWPYAINAKLEFEDIDRNGTTDLIFPQNEPPFHCTAAIYRIPKDVYMWDGEYYQFMWTDPGAPEFRFQAALDGDYYSIIGLFDQAETAYLRAVFDESLKPGSMADWKKETSCLLDPGERADPTEPARIRAYARFRLVELYVRIGRVMEAESHRTYLRTNYPLGSPGYIYAYLANTFWWEYVKDEDMTAACAAVRSEAEKNQTDVFALFDNYQSLMDGPTLDTICPFST